MSNSMQPGVPVRVFDSETTDDLGIVHMPLPIEVGDRLAIEDHPGPLEVVNVIATRAGAKVAALVEARPALSHPA
jgi:hypothetical protein